MVQCTTPLATEMHLAASADTQFVSGWDLGEDPTTILWGGFAGQGVKCIGRAGVWTFAKIARGNNSGGSIPQDIFARHTHVARRSEMRSVLSCQGV